MARRRRAYTGYYPAQTWWTRETGGLPGWAIAGSAGLLSVLGAFIAVLSTAR